MLALLEVRARARSGEWDVLVVDCAPTAETLRLLALPEALGWYMTRVLPLERRVVKALKPVLTRAAGVPMPEDSVFDAIERLHAELDDVRAVLTGPETSVRLVLTPESVVLAEARRAYTFLTLFGYSRRRGDREPGLPRRAAPTSGVRPGSRRRSASWPTPPTRSPASTCCTSVYRAAEPVGREELLDLARAVYGDTDPLAAARPDRRWRSVAGRRRGAPLPLPLAAQDDVRLARKGDELVVSVASYRRLLTLPTGLARHRVAGARVRDGGAPGPVHRTATPSTETTTASRGTTVTDASDAHDVGSLGEEAAKLPRRAVGLGPRAAGDAGDGLSGFAAQAASSAHDLNEHLATGPPSARSARSAARSTPSASSAPRSRPTSPPRRASLAQAAAAIMATAHRRTPGDAHGVEHIDLRDNWPEDA